MEIYLTSKFKKSYKNLLVQIKKKIEEKEN